MSTIIDVRTIPRPRGFTLHGLNFSIRFHGDVLLSMQDLPEYIPVQISIQLEEKWTGLSPVVHSISTGDPTFNETLTTAMFPFLPLPQGFEPMDTYHWQELTKEIEEDLLADPHLDSTYPERYHLMRELFWMAFVAAFPTFPHGDFPLWNPEIPMEGDFISHWVLKDVDEVDVPDTDVRKSIWKQFTTTIEQTLSIPPC